MRLSLLQFSSDILAGMGQNTAGKRGAEDKIEKLHCERISSKEFPALNLNTVEGIEGEELTNGLTDNEPHMQPRRRAYKHFP